MAIARKPQTKSSEQQSRVDVEALIAKGGSIGRADAPSSENEDEVSAFTLRVPTKLLHRLDGHRKKGALKRNRQYWILEAIVEKLEREEG